MKTIQLEGSKIECFEVIHPDGNRLCQINICPFPDGEGNVDVILNGATQRGTFLAWDKGVPHVRTQTNHGTTVHAVDIRKIK